MFQKKYPDLKWEYVVVSADEPGAELPDFVKSFPTSLLLKDGEPAYTIIAGYESVGKILHAVIHNS